MPRLFLILFATLLLPLAGQAQEIVVSPDGPVRSLAEAVESSAPHGRIVVEAGTYAEETVTIDRPLEIVGRGDAVLDGEGERGLLLVKADSVTVRGLTFRNVGTTFVDDRAAVKLDSVRSVVIENNRFENTFFGIYLAKTAESRISGNVLTASHERQSRAGNGIHLWYSKEITITDNQIRGHRDGIYLEFVEDSEVRGNVSEDNLRYGLHFMFSDRCAYRSNVFRENEAGVAVMYSENVEMTDNRFFHNWGSASYGLLLKDITDSHIARNHFEKNTIGILAEGSNRMRVEDNDFLQNGWAVKIMANAEDNLFTDNNFVGNTFDVATNSRQSYSTFEGNYWDNYAGYDLDRDGVGDVAFRPVRLFALIVERNAPALFLLRSFFVDLLDAAERVLPALTPETLVDARPLMNRIER